MEYQSSFICYFVRRSMKFTDLGGTCRKRVLKRKKIQLFRKEKCEKIEKTLTKSSEMRYTTDKEVCLCS